MGKEVSLHGCKERFGRVNAVSPEPALIATGVGISCAMSLPKLVPRIGDPDTHNGPGDRPQRRGCVSRSVQLFFPFSYISLFLYLVGNKKKSGKFEGVLPFKPFTRCVSAQSFPLYSAAHSLPVASVAYSVSNDDT